MWESASSISKVCGKGGKQHHRFPGFPQTVISTACFDRRNSHAAIFTVASIQFCSNSIGLTYFSVECMRVRLYQSNQEMVSSLASRMFSKRWLCNRSTFSEPNNVSEQ